MALAAAFSGAACSGQYGEATPLEIVDSPAKAPANGPIPTLDPGAPTPLPDGDGGTSEPRRCDPTRPFASVTDVAGFAYPEGNYGPPRLSQDELSLQVPMQTSPGIVALYVATRSSRTAAFGQAAPFAGIAAGAQNSYQLSPNLSNDSLALVFEGVPGTSTAASSIFVTTRPSVVAPFAAPRALALQTVNPREPYVLAGGNAVYFTDGHVHRASMPSAGAAGDVVAITELDDPMNGKAGARYPVVRSDELAIYWQASKQGGTVGTADLYVATRMRKSQPFGAIRTVAEVNTPSGDEYPSWISPDGCRLYVMTFNPNGGNPSATLRVANLAP